MQCYLQIYVQWSWLSLPLHRVKTYIVNGWDRSIVDPDPQKKYTLGTELAASQSKQADDDCKLGARWNEQDLDGWPKGPCSQQSEEVCLLPCLLTDVYLPIWNPLESKCKPKKVSHDDHSTSKY